MLVAIDHQKLFDAMFLENCFGLIQSRADGNRHQRLFGHHFRDRQLESFFKSKIAIRDNAHQVAVFINHRHAADVITLHHVERFAHRAVLPDRHRIHDHAGFRAFHFVDFFGLPFDTQVLMNYADAALLRDSDRQRRFGDGVHRGRAKRYLQANAPSELR